MEKFVKNFFGGVRIHFSLKKIYGSAILFFTRFMPTNGFVQPFVGMISFLSMKDGDPYGNRTHVCGVRGRRLNRLTNGPYTLRIDIASILK